MAVAAYTFPIPNAFFRVYALFQALEKENQRLLHANQLEYNKAVIETLAGFFPQNLNFRAQNNNMLYSRLLLKLTLSKTLNFRAQNK